MVNKICFDKKHQLHLHCFFQNNPNGVGILFLFGGGWRNGTPLHFYNQAEYFTALGYTCFCCEYRVLSQYENETPKICLEDVYSAAKYIKLNCDKFKINNKKLVLAGGSAGGHLALCCAIMYEDIAPCAIMLFNPVVDTTTSGFSYGTPLFKGNEKTYSPTHILNKKLPKTFIVHGESDTTVTLNSINIFVEKCKTFGTTVVLHLYPGETHGFFNHPTFREECNMQTYLSVLKDCEKFLNDLA